MRRLFFILMFLTASSSSFSASPLHSYTLDNGLKLIVKEDHRSPVVISMLWYRVGSTDEVGGKTGLAHVLEHMMFKGTPKYPVGLFSKIIAKSGGQENAFTNNDYTAYFEYGAKDHLDTYLKLEADRLAHLNITDDNFSKEIKVIQEERRLRTDDNPQGIAYERFLATAYLNNPYQHPVIGWMSDLMHLNTQDVKDWYNRFYAPDNATLVVIGDVSPDKVFELTKRYFNPIKKKTHITRKPQIEPQGLGKKYVEVNIPAKLPLLMMGYTVPTVSTTEKSLEFEPYALEVIAAILDAGESSRLARQIIRGSHIASTADADYSLYERYQTQFTLTAIPSEGHTLDEVKQNLMQIVQKLKSTSVSNKELNRVKTQLIAQKTFEKDSVFGQAMVLGLLATLELPLATEAHYAEHIKNITSAQIQQVAKKYFNDNVMTEARLLPQTMRNTHETH